MNTRLFFPLMALVFYVNLAYAQSTTLDSWFARYSSVASGSIATGPSTKLNKFLRYANNPAEGTVRTLSSFLKLVNDEDIGTVLSAKPEELEKSIGKIEDRVLKRISSAGNLEDASSQIPASFRGWGSLKDLDSEAKSWIHVLLTEGLAISFEVAKQQQGQSVLNVDQSVQYVKAELQNVDSMRRFLRSYSPATSSIGNFLSKAVPDEKDALETLAGLGMQDASATISSLRSAMPSLSRLIERRADLSTVFVDGSSTFDSIVHLAGTFKNRSISRDGRAIADDIAVVNSAFGDSAKRRAISAILSPEELSRVQSLLESFSASRDVAVSAIKDYQNAENAFDADGATDDTDGVGSAIGFVNLGLGLVGGKQSAELQSFSKVMTTAANGIALVQTGANLLENSSSLLGAIGSATSMLDLMSPSTLVAGGIIGIASAFGQKSEAKELRKIEASVQAVRQDIAAMKTDMDNRFDHVDVMLGAVQSKLIEEFAKTDKKLDDMAEGISSIREYLVAGDVSHLTSALNQFDTLADSFASGLENDYESNFRVWLLSHNEEFHAVMAHFSRLPLGSEEPTKSDPLRFLFSFGNSAPKENAIYNPVYWLALLDALRKISPFISAKDAAKYLRDVLETYQEFLPSESLLGAYDLDKVQAELSGEIRALKQAKSRLDPIYKDLFRNFVWPNVKKNHTTGFESQKSDIVMSLYNNIPLDYPSFFLEQINKLQEVAGWKGITAELYFDAGAGPVNSNTTVTIPFIFLKQLGLANGDYVYFTPTPLRLTLKYLGVENIAVHHQANDPTNSVYFGVGEMNVSMRIDLPGNRSVAAPGKRQILWPHMNGAVPGKLLLTDIMQQLDVISFLLTHGSSWDTLFDVFLGEPSIIPKLGFYFDSSVMDQFRKDVATSGQAMSSEQADPLGLKSATAALPQLSMDLFRVFNNSWDKDADFRSFLDIISDSEKCGSTIMTINLDGMSGIDYLTDHLGQISNLLAARGSARYEPSSFIQDGLQICSDICSTLRSRTTDAETLRTIAIFAGFFDSFVSSATYDEDGLKFKNFVFEAN